ncbi:MAG: bifunctional (p)ppGpp synthetase/guanosine-3',5'-bis(diphosphate) 3'-pyrophosphohydrolase [Clostridia bacterium]|nr:bifunctional (p)ppGpp synthetase/guanosine-3',5'-bis(diphosphate) 3'-pyrophosphohydrolase [Clostridia bacterium]
MQHTYEELIEKIKSYNPQADFEMIEKAYLYAKDMHKNQKRESGEPYIIHPLEVAYILADMQIDHEAIVAGILHDVIEDTETSYDEIKQLFGENVALMVEGVTKLDKIQFENKEEQQIESLRKMFLAMAKDIRVILIKLADRLHNMRTLKSMPPEKRLQKSKETLEVYAALAHRLGISKIKWELEDLSLRYLDSVAYYEIVESIKKKRNEREKYIEDIKIELSERLSALNINFKIEGRAKHFYSIFRKMYAQNKSIDEIYDLFAVRIIVDSVSDCYTALGMVHEIYKPIPGRFKDYIAMPKPNMYQSLHTTLIGPEGIPFEVQIRTFEMHETAEHGIAAHWKYKEGTTEQKNTADAKFSWIRQLLETQQDADNEEEFMRALKIDLFADEVFVFTPRGDVINLPVGSTPIDFAFAIHSAVGSKMMGAKVNSKIVPLDYTLSTGDIVEVLTSASVHGPSKDWLKICKTSQAKSKINQWFKKANREADIERGKEMIEKECKRQGYTTAQLLKKEYTEQCLKRYSFANMDDMYAAVGYGTITSAKIITRLINAAKEAEEQPVPEIPAEFTEQKTSTGKGSNIKVKGIDNCLVRVSRCCTPLPGDDIIGFITRGRGVSVHRTDCVNIQPESLSEEERSRIIECCWADGTKGTYLCDIQIESTDRNGLLADITIAVGEHKLGIMALNSRATKNRLAIITITLEATDAEQIDNLIKRLYTIRGIYNVTRSH